MPKAYFIFTEAVKDIEALNAYLLGTIASGFIATPRRASGGFDHGRR